VAEVPVSVRYENRASTTRGRAMLDMLRELLQIRGNWKHGGAWSEDRAALQIHERRAA
jgi:hypothetical protein